MTGSTVHRSDCRLEQLLAVVGMVPLPPLRKYGPFKGICLRIIHLLTHLQSAWSDTHGPTQTVGAHLGACVPDNQTW